MECTVKQYIQSKSSLCAKICAIEELIDAMLLNMVDSVEMGGTASYVMDDGQMKVTTIYRSVDDVIKGVEALQKLKQTYINRYNGHTTVLRGRLNF